MAVDQFPPDPLQSPVWDAMVDRYLNDAPVVFDDKVKIGLPPVTEDQTQVPIMIDARRLGQVDEVVVIGDLSPFPMTVRIKPNGAPAVLAFRMRIEQGTVIRAAAKKDGKWRVGEAYLDATGGGCSAPPSTEAKVAWDDIGHMRAKIWRETPDLLRVRLRILHPMDTGLQKEPAFYIHSIAVNDSEGKALNNLDVHEPIAANPVFTMLVADPKNGDHLAVAARDTDGGNFSAKIPLPASPPLTHKIQEGRL